MKKQPYACKIIQHSIFSLRMQKIACAKMIGFTLIEVLIAILVLCIGIVSALGLQVVSIKSSTDARYQSAALELSADLAALMRSNPKVSTLTAVAANPYLIDRNAVVPSFSAAGGISVLNAKDRATYDIERWYARAYDALPGVRVRVCFDSVPYDVDGIPLWECGGGKNLYIKIGWSLRSGAAGGGRLDLGRPQVVIPVGVCNPDANGGSSVGVSCFKNS